MIKLNTLDSNGKGIMYYYDVDATTWYYGSFSEIVANNAAPPSKLFPLDLPAAGGIYDHAFIFTLFDNPSFSTSMLQLGGVSNFWTSLDLFIAEVTTGLPSVDRIYIVLTEIEYTGFNSTTFKSYCQIGFDVYVA